MKPIDGLLLHAQYDAQCVGYQPEGPDKDAELAEIAFCFRAPFPIGENGPKGVYGH